MAWILLLPLCAVGSIGALEKPVGCTYMAPVGGEADGKFFKEINLLANTGGNFEEVLAFLEARQINIHRFDFRYALKDQAQAEVFGKVLQIKAQEAHRFVPVIEISQFIEPAHLGFLRQIAIKDGPIVQEHVLVDQNRVIFVEEWVITEGKIQPGKFAAVNRIIEENGVWYFAGTYLYEEGSDEKGVAESSEMFRKTYENMAAFAESDDVNVIYASLKPY